MSLPMEFKYTVPWLYGGEEQTLWVHGGLTALVGPNGSGKTKVLRALRPSIGSALSGKQDRHKQGIRIFVFEGNGRIRKKPIEFFHKPLG